MTGELGVDLQPPLLPLGARGETPLSTTMSNSSNMKHARKGEKWNLDLRCNELPAKTGAGTGVAVSFWEHRALTSREKQHAGSSQDWEGSVTKFCSISASPVINSSPQRKHAPAAPRHVVPEAGSRAPCQAGPSSSHKTHVRLEHAKPLKTEFLSSSWRCFKRNMATLFLNDYI